MVLCYLLLDFLHDLDFALKQLSKRADSVVLALRYLAVVQGELSLFDLVYKAFRDLFLCAGYDEVEELFVAHNRLVVIRHQIH